MEPDGVSPLQHFVLAKRTVTSIFQQILDFMQEGADFVQETWRSEDLQHVAEEEQTLQIQSCSSKLTVIRDVLARRHMKVAFFGRTSNGKSTVINAMLRERVLPSGIGHTTNCFLSVEGTDEELAFLTTEDSKQKKNIETVNELAHALHMDRSLDSGSLVRVFWPKAKCALLRDDLVLMDSPGTDVTSELDSWIDKFCLDADVFVLVANSESTIMNTEKHFFHKVNEHISKPNIFILNNRWDASILEPEYLEQVRKQHLDRCVTFLVEELKVVDLAQAPDRIFFISAKEVLSARTLHSQRLPETGGALPEGFQERLREFQDFERTFEEFISQSAVKTKFEQHTIRAWQIMESVKSVMDAINISSAEQKVYSLEEREALMDRLEFVRNHLDFLTEDIKDKIKATAEEVASKVSNAIVEETRFLTLLADEFSADFCPEQSTVYKTKLVGFVEKRMTTKLDYRCSSSIYGIMLSSQTDIMNTICPLLPPAAQGQLRLSSRKFVIHYDLNFSRLCEDFAEDIDFHFSLGFASLVKRFLGPTKAKQALRLLRQKAQENLAKSLATELVSLTPRASVGMLIVAGVVWRSVGWRAIVLSMSFYTLLYLYERLSWTNSLKEKVLKQQFVDYVTDRLQVVSSVISSDCGLQVQQEMVSNFARMCQVVEKSEMELESEINRFSSRIQRLESVQRHSKTLRHKATDLASQLECFSEQYLQIQLDQD